MFKPGSKFSSSDLDFFGKYNEIVKSGGTANIQNLANSMNNVSSSAINVATSAQTAGEEINIMGIQSKATAIGMKALSVAGNMLMFVAIAEAIKLAAWAAKELTDSCEDTEERFKSLSDEFDKNKSKLEEINTTLTDNKQKIQEILNLDNPTYADEKDLKNLKEENKQLKQKAVVLERIQNATAHKALETLEDKFDNEFVTNNKKLEDKTKLDSIEDFAKNIFTLGGYNIYQSQKYNDEKGDYEKTVDSLNLLQKLKDKKTGTNYFYDVDGIKKNLDEYYLVISKHIAERQEFDPKLETMDSKYWIELQDKIFSFTDPEKWTTDTVKSTIEKTDFTKVSETIKEKFAQGLIKDDKGLLSDTDAQKMIKSVAMQLYDKADNESLKLAASQIVKYFSGNLTEEGEKPSSFENVFNNFDKKDKLLELANSGKLTPSTLELSKYNDLLSETGTKAEDACNKINAMVSSSDRMKAIAEDLSTMSAAYKEYKDNGFVGAESIGKMTEKFGDLTSFKNEEFQNVVGSSSTTSEQKQSAFNNLAQEYLDEGDALGKLNEANKDAYATELKSLGIKNATEIVNRKLYTSTNAQKLVTDKLKMSMGNFNSKSYENQKALLDSAEASDETRSYLANLQVQEIEYNKQNLDTTGKISALENLAQAYGLAGTMAQNLAAQEKAAKKMEQYDHGTGNVTGFNQLTQQDYENSLNDIKDKISAKFGILYGKVDYTTTDKDAEKMRKETEKQAKEAKKNSNPLDWVSVKIDNIKKQIKNAIDEVTDYASRKTKQGSLASAISGLEQSKVVNRNAYNSYMAKANSLGLSGDLQNKIKNGDYSIIDYDSDTSDKINKYKEYYQNAQTAAEQIKEDAKTELDYRKQLAEINAKKYENNNSTLEARNSKIEGVIDLSNASGKRVFTSAYRKMIKNSIAEIGNYNAQLNIWQDYSKTLDKTSDAYATVKDTINGIAASIQKCKQSQAEWNTEIQKIKLTKLQNDLELLQGKNTKMASKVSRSEDLGLIPSKSLYQGQMKGNDRQIANLNGQNKAYEDMLKSVQNSNRIIHS